VGVEEVAGAEALPDLVGLLDRCQLEDFQADFVSWGFYRPEPWRNYWHTHSFYEVCLAYAGSGVFRHGEDEVKVAAGDVFLARPGVLHEIGATADQGLGIAFWGFTLTPTPEPDRPGWWSGLASGPVVSRQLGSIPGVLAALAKEAAEPRAGHTGLCAALGAALVIDTARAFGSAASLAVQPQRRDRRSTVVDAIRRHLLDNLARPVTVRDVAAAVHLSQRHAERLFATQTGASMMTTLRRLRLEQAGTLLLDTEQSTSAVARACGYADPGSFSTAFRRHHGQPPQAFRANGGTLQLAGVGGHQ